MPRDWRVVVRLRNRDETETIVRDGSGADALTVGVTVLLDRAGMTEHEGAWCYFA